MFIVGSFASRRFRSDKSRDSFAICIKEDDTEISLEFGSHDSDHLVLILWMAIDQVTAAIGANTVKNQCDGVRLQEFNAINAPALIGSGWDDAPGPRRISGRLPLNRRCTQ